MTVDTNICPPQEAIKQVLSTQLCFTSYINTSKKGGGGGGGEGGGVGGEEGEGIVDQDVMVLVISHLARFEGAATKSRPTQSILLCLTNVYKFICGQALALPYIHLTYT